MATFNLKNIKSNTLENFDEETNKLKILESKLREEKKKIKEEKKKIKEEFYKDYIKGFQIRLYESDYNYFINLISLKKIQNNYSYKLYDSIIEGIEIFKQKNKNFVIPFNQIPQRYNSGQNRKSEKGKIEKVKSTTILIKKEYVEWINFFIEKRRIDNLFYSQKDFFREITETLKEK
ncbi:hypothetical protein BWK57_13580 [Flavobacterium columnare]|uniref:hypothetical protein n=1 Tax=Flavobacterium columnare TaxID=996 RepID=UPI000CDB6E8F|nr:hypothetical protein [Flavobacterium columnare]POR19421.1 hypothetical protein BWK57_13580 [Flavobacterium columnare]